MIYSEAGGLLKYLPLDVPVIQHIEYLPVFEKNEAVLATHANADIHFAGFANEIHILSASRGGRDLPPTGNPDNSAGTKRSTKRPNVRCSRTGFLA
jgi:hypothetical protein